MTSENAEMDRRKSPASHRFLLFWALGCAVVWTVLPSVFCKVLPLDTIEAITWGRYWAFGNYKHPPLSGYLAYGVSFLTNHADWPLFLLSQILVLTALFYSYKLARLFFDEDTASRATLLLGFALFYNLFSIKYNVNTLELAFWPMTAYYFYRGVRENRMRDWLLLGVAGALNVLSKHFGVLLLFCLFCYFWCDRESRKYWKSPGPYCAALVFFSLIAPHLYWLFQNDFLPFRYVEERLQENGAGWYAPFRALGLLCYPLCCMAGFVLAALACRGIRPFPVRLKKNDAAAVKFALFTMGLPALVMFGMTVCGAYMDVLWCYPIYFSGGILLMALFRAKLTPGAGKILAWFVIGFSVGVAAAYTGYALSCSKDRRNIDPAVVAAAAREFYTARRPGGIVQICGTMWVAGMLQRELGGNLPLCVIEDPVECRLFPLRDGALLIGENPEQMIAFAARQGARLINLVEREFQYQAVFGRRKRTWFYFAVAQKNGQSVEKIR